MEDQKPQETRALELDPEHLMPKNASNV